MKKENATNNSKMISGAIIGAVVGITAGILAGSTVGKELGKDIKKKSIEFYKYLAPQLRKIKHLSEKQYKDFVKKALERYSEEKKLSVEEGKRLLKEAVISWENIKNNL